MKRRGTRDIGKKPKYIFNAWDLHLSKHKQNLSLRADISLFKAGRQRLSLSLLTSVVFLSPTLLSINKNFLLRIARKTRLGLFAEVLEMGKSWERQRGLDKD